MDSISWSKIKEHVDEFGCGTVEFISETEELTIQDISTEDGGETLVVELG